MTAEAGRRVASARGAAGFWSRLRAEGAFWQGVVYDALRFRRHAWLHRVRSPESRNARMLADAHFLEYGMALREARPGFGLARSERLAGDLIEGGQHEAAGQIGLATLRDWAAFNRGTTLPDGIAPALALPGGEDIAAGVRQTDGGGAFGDYLAFARSRHSVRQFAPGPVPEAAIRRAVAAAQAAPSSCNRQTCTAHVWTDRALIDRVRRHQAGNRTFGHELGGIAVITSDLRHWEHAGERYQPWIDGGLFAMSLCHGLHAEGLGTCFLNWSVTPATDRGLRAELGLDETQLVIVLLGFGLMPDRVSVCASPRLPEGEALRLNPPLAD
ncbi:nitroreductase family protein [Pararhodobacter sp. CCB-MM2]|uniref:nitroreductase family protein n=1 Tax=Pararhodobacter sp. CCB-MM2 TaxID=1786003 RepID=UPI000834D402|nr:nitroreductase family protein [Pararhodobacter sp. CCB-MM2]